ncbi:MAG: hypothetical protein J1F63_08120 [Oscillospiraceae bacterium]|nr:hypothetical protein [Oscillospiraceae bacterium]
MGKIFAKNLFCIYFKDCPLCGLNTALLPENERVEVGREVFCRPCYEAGKNKKRVTPADYYHVSLQNQKIDGDHLLQLNNEILCSGLPNLPIAHLHGKMGEEDDFNLDLRYDQKNDKIYFRSSLVDDPDPWYGTETYKYITAEQAIYLLNKNGIHILDGMNESNWKDYFEF